MCPPTHLDLHAVNGLLYADWQHPVDFIEPQELNASDSEESRAIIPPLIWADAPDTIAEKAHRITAILEALMKNSAEGIEPNAIPEMPTEMHPRANTVLMEILSWAARGVSVVDVGLRGIVIFRALKVGNWPDLSLAEIAEMKKVSKQRIWKLDTEFHDLYQGLR